MIKHLRPIVLLGAILAALATLTAQSFPPSAPSPVTMTPSFQTLASPVTVPTVAQFTTGVGLVLGSGKSFGWSSTTDPAVAPDLAFTRVAAGEYATTAVLFTNLGTPANGTFCYCSDCTIAAPCASGGTGAFAKRLAGAWACN